MRGEVQGEVERVLRGIKSWLFELIILICWSDDKCDNHFLNNADIAPPFWDHSPPLIYKLLSLITWANHRLSTSFLGPSTNTSSIDSPDKPKSKGSPEVMTFLLWVHVLSSRTINLPVQSARWVSIEPLSMGRVLSAGLLQGTLCTQKYQEYRQSV